MTLQYSNISNLQTSHGDFKCFSVRDNDIEHLILYKGDIENSNEITVRIHSSCMTGDIFGSLRCDCQDQLHKSLKIISKDKNGIIIYLKQEGRGIGIFNKINAYNLQDQGYDTVDANIKLGLEVDNRRYDIACEILSKLNPKKIKILTNNPKKINILKKSLNCIVERVSLQIESNKYNEKYLFTKHDKLGHIK